MKPFSLERAQAGDPIMIAPICGNLEWRPAHFVGLSRDGSPVVQIESVVITSPDQLRMAPKKRIVFVNIMKGGPAAWFVSAYAAEAAGHTRPVIACAVPVEITD